MEMIGDYCQPSQAEFLRQSALVHRSYAARWSRNEFAAGRSCTVAEHLRSSSEDSGEGETFEHTWVAAVRLRGWLGERKGVLWDSVISRDEGQAIAGMEEKSLN